MATAPDPITSTPGVPGQPYDATSSEAIGKWGTVEASSGPASFETGACTGDFESGPGPWKQT